ncbi:MAG: DUF2202 domain-containing protein [Thermodesulfobacteriota bacterium]
MTDAEKDWLIFMCEEEKLARDVYLYLFEKWGSPVFDNISASEQTHMDAIKALLVKYNTPDPTAGNGEGVFVDEFLRDLYKTLTDAGSVSLVEGLKAGVFIEMTDIKDLTAAIAETERIDIERVYTNLRKGSQHHWDAFCSHLVELEEQCQPYELLEP